MHLGFDVGGTKTDAVVVACGDRILARVRRPTGWGAAAVVSTVTELTAELARTVGIAPSEFTSIGIGMPGQVAPGSATVTHAVNLGIDELDLSAAIGSRFGVAVRAENDVKAAALGAYSLHGATGSMGYLNLGTGIAAGLVVDGRLWRGARGSAGEVGHISVDPRGRVCKCGQRGCIEALCGGGAVAEAWDRPGSLPVRDVFDAADEGDPLAVELRDRLAYGVAAAVRVIVLGGDLDSVVLGGGITALGDRLLSRVVTELEGSAAASPFLASLRLTDRISLLPTGSPAAALGAAIIGASATEQEALTHG